MKLFTSAIQWQWLLLLQLIFLSSTTCGSLPHEIPRLTPFYEPILQHLSSKPLPPDFITFYYTQTLDHFNYAPQSYATFQQRYIVNSKYWGGWLGAESPIDTSPASVGFLPNITPHFKALLVYIEHRFYGESIPFGDIEEGLINDTIRGYFSSAQALADYAEVLLYIKNSLSAHDSPIIVIGGSYGGMLASWFRLKYPHIALGALASSAPILYFDNITPENEYYSIVTKDFREVSDTCYQTIKQSWLIIDTIASQPNGLSILSRKFNFCQDLNSALELKNYLDRMYCAAAQYDTPAQQPVRVVCGGIDGAPKGADILDRIQAGVVAIKGNKPCYTVSAIEGNQSFYTVSAGGDDGWSWQTCSELVFPIAKGNDSMFDPDPFNLEQYSQSCISAFGVPPRPHWVTTYFGGQDIKLVLRNFGSNIIFSNGGRDPYSRAGVLEDISDTILAVYTQNGSHCLDLHGETTTDPNWLVKQRKKEVKIIQGWITNYYKDLRAIKNKAVPIKIGALIWTVVIFLTLGMCL